MSKVTQEQAVDAALVMEEYLEDTGMKGVKYDLGNCIVTAELKIPVEVIEKKGN
jgi:hypothetical protein